MITKLIEPGHLDWPTAIRKMSLNPARILGIAKGTLQIGADADVTIIDPKVRWTVDPSKFRSKSTEHALCRLGVDRPGRGGDRRRTGEVQRRD